jgi:N-acetylglutamate synthase-like GNAT family acetyltransferase
MRKLFITDSKSKNFYSKYLIYISNFVIDSYKIEFDDKKINNNFLRKFDVIIFNYLPEKFLNFLDKQRIIKILINSNNYENINIDILINLKKDLNSKKKCKNFNSIKYSFINSSEVISIINIITILKWDTKFWGIKIGYLSSRFLTKNIIYRVSKFVKNNSITMVQFLSDFNDQSTIYLAEKNNFSFKDIRVTLKKNIKSSFFFKNKNFSYRIANKNDLPKIKDIIKDLYLDSRYNFDINFKKSKINQFYYAWVKKSINGTFDDFCYLVLRKGIVIGFCTIKLIEKSIGKIGLFGIKKSFQGMGAASALLKYTESKLSLKNVNKLIVITQGRNNIAQRVYQKNKFYNSSAEIWYHKWYN